MREVVSTKDAPQAIGPYSQAIKANGLVFTSGQIAIDPATQQVVAGDVAAQTDRVLCEVVLAGSRVDVAATGREMRRRGGCPLEPILAGLGQKPKASKSERLTLSAALLAAEALGPTARKTLPGVLVWLRDPRIAIRSYALAALAEIMPERLAMPERPLTACRGSRIETLNPLLPPT